MVKKYKPYLSSVLLACAVGALSGFLSRNGMQEFQTSVLKPPLTPPPILFPIVWTILYVLMGLGAALVAQSPSGRSQRTALRIYALQLAVNFFWSILFFNFSAYFAAFLWLILLWVLVLLMIWSFAGVNRAAALLQIPYLLWLTFAAYLNWGVWVLNRSIGTGSAFPPQKKQKARCPLRRGRTLKNRMTVLF